MRSAIKQKGFTLVEVMIVVAIVGIMTAIATPMITSMLPRYYLRAAARELVIDFKKAKMEAVKRNRDVVINFTGAGTPNGSYQIYVNNDNNTPLTFDPPTDIQLVNQQFQSNVRLFSISPTLDPTGGYNSRGLPLKSGNVVLRTSDGSREYTLSISLAGNVSLQ